VEALQMELLEQAEMVEVVVVVRGLLALARLAQ
jgi:hypothetical protein